MGKMVRKQIYIEPRQDEALKRRAAELGTTEAELIRRCIDREIEEAGDAEQRRRQAWERFEAYARERAKVREPQTGRGWTRDELYDERLDRIAPR